jgi:iron complex outermembrane receptor protein
MRVQLWIALASTMSGTSALAQATQAQSPPKNIDEVVVLGSAFQKSTTDIISTTEVLSQDKLRAKMDLPLGDVLSHLPGVSSANHGPAVSRPIIRGASGYRIAVLNDAMPVGDISATGNDHANALQLFDSQRLEVLKGPSALRYGPYAATGVVQNFSRHMEAPKEEAQSHVYLGYGSAADETLGAAYHRFGQYAISGFSQNSDEIRIPTHAESARQLAAEGETAEDKAQDAANTSTRSHGMTGSAVFGTQATQLNLRVENLDMHYGVPGHAHEEKHDEDDEEEEEEHGSEAARIELDSQTLQARLTHRPNGQAVDRLQADVSLVRYAQDEMEGASLGTQFEQDSLNLRLEASKDFADWQSLFGLSLQQVDLTTAGDEAFLPSSDSQQIGVFGFATRSQNNWVQEYALRFDQAEAEKSTGTKISHDLTNASFGIGYTGFANSLIGGSASHAQRAPARVELFANGVHVAADRQETGDAALKRETALATELYIRRQWDTTSARASVFHNDYEDFIYLHLTNGNVDPKTYAYRQEDATLRGLELQASTRLTVLAATWDATLGVTRTQAKLANGQRVRSIPPTQINLGLAADYPSFRLAVDVEHANQQSKLAAGELASDAFTKLNISARWPVPQTPSLVVTAALRNATDEEVRHHTSDLKDLLPEAGRDLRLSLDYRF